MRFARGLDNFSSSFATYYCGYQQLQKTSGDSNVGRKKKRIFYGQAGGSATFWRDSVSEKLATNFETKIFKFRRLLG